MSGVASPCPRGTKEEMDARLEIWGDARIELCKAVLETTSSGKRRKVDPQLRERLTVVLPSEGVSELSGSSVRLLLGKGRTQHLEWLGKTIREHQAAQWLTCSKYGAVGLSMDGVTAGWPKQDYLLSVVYNVDAARSCVGRPAIERTALKSVLKSVC